MKCQKKKKKKDCLLGVSNTASFSTGCCRLWMDDVVLYIPQSYPFCSHRSRDLCKDIHARISKGACMCLLQTDRKKACECLYNSALCWLCTGIIARLFYMCIYIMNMYILRCVLYAHISTYQNLTPDFIWCVLQHIQLKDVKSMPKFRSGKCNTMRCNSILLNKIILYTSKSNKGSTWCMSTSCICWTLMVYA